MSISMSANLSHSFSDYFSDANNFKNFNELWIRNGDRSLRGRWQPQAEEQNSHVNWSSYYLWILLFAILVFICLIHRVSQHLLRVTTRSKAAAYSQVTVLPGYL